MAVEKDVYSESFAAGADFNTKQYLAVMLSAQDTVAIATAGALCMGVLQNNPPSGSASQVRVLGITMWVSDGTTPISVNDRLKSDGNGKAVKSSSDHDNVCGIAMSASSADGTVIYALLTPGVSLSA